MSFSGVMNPDLLNAFRQLITSKTGIHIREQDYLTLVHKIVKRANVLNISLPETYYHLLETDSPASKQEWKNLIGVLTNVESYFFRDQGQFSLLREQILPELMAQNQRQKSLRIWSAGCSTGEEPYSLAILLHQQLASLENWDLTIVGTDINHNALAKAKQGIYNSWSLRTLDDPTIAKYFTSTFKGYQLNTKIRNLVSFQEFNLVENIANKINLRDFDLIICRNVFIYFDAASIGMALNNFANALRKGGYLVTGHAELYGQDLSKFSSKIFPNSIVYQYSDSQAQKNQYLSASPIPLNPKPISSWSQPMTPLTDIPLTVPPTIPLPASPPRPKASLPQPKKPPTSDFSPHDRLLEEAENLFTQKSYKLATQKAKESLKYKPDNFKAYSLLASIFANSGQYEEASYFCQKALEINSFSVEIYYLLAQIAEEQENYGEAKRLFKKIIYLDPTSVPAYYELSYLYEQEGDRKRAEKMYQSAVELLRKFPPMDETATKNNTKELYTDHLAKLEKRLQE